MSHGYQKIKINATRAINSIDKICMNSADLY